MFKFIGNAQIPSVLRGPLLVDTVGLPRFWAAIWSLYAFPSLADSSASKQLRHIEAFYQFADGLKGPGALDDAIGEVDVEVLGEVLGAYFISLQNQPTLNQATQAKWQTALGFVQNTILRLSKSSLSTKRIQDIETSISRLQKLYQQLRIGKRRTQETLRSLPAVVVEALYAMLDPASAGNPFRNDAAKWRVFILFIVLLHQGLRRGELLLLPADAVKEEYDHKVGRRRYWINVVQNPYEANDPRYSKPSIKTADSVRQVPVSELTANLIQEYVENYRGKPAHSFLMNSQHNKPLSLESVAKLFAKISSALPKSALQTLESRTGKITISPHDLRHTCAVVRLNQLLTQGDSMDEALQKMRTFFGWSRASDMPRKYARAVFEDRLSGIWSNVFDDRVAFLRAMPGAEI